MQRMFTVSTVHFQHRVSEEQHDRMMAAVGAAGVSQDLVVETMRNRLLHICQAAARAMTDEMSKWPAEQWQVECGLRITNAVDCEDAGAASAARDTVRLAR